MSAVFDVFTSLINFYSYICNYTVYFPYTLNPFNPDQTCPHIPPQLEQKCFAIKPCFIFVCPFVLFINAT